MKLPEPTRREGCASDLRLDELLVGELDAETERATREHIAACARCSLRLEAIEAERDAFFASAPELPRATAPRAEGAPGVGRQDETRQDETRQDETRQDETRQEETPRGEASRAGRGAAVVPLASRRSRAWMGSVAGALAAAAALVLFLRTRPDAPQGEAVEPGADFATRLKGGERLGFYVRRGRAVARGGPGERVAPGDALQFTVTMTGRRHVAVLGLDGAGKASVYFPAGSRAVPIDPGQDVPLPSSTVLDDTLGTEAIHALFCDAPVELEPPRRALEATPSSFRPPPGCTDDRVVIEKVVREGEASP